MSNQVFHFPRFTRYAKAHFKEKKRTYQWFFGIIAMIYFLVLLMVLTSSPRNFDWELHTFFYYSGLLITGPIFALRYFSSLAQPCSALVALMQPVSTFEKWVLSALTTLFLYPIVYTVLFNLMTIPANLAAIATFPNYEEWSDTVSWTMFIYIPLLNGSLPNLGKDESLLVIEQVPLWLVYYGLCAYALTASIFFKRLPTIKAVALGFGLFMLLLLFVVGFGNSSTMDVLFSYWWSDWRHYEKHTMATIANIVIWLVAPTLMFIASFFALKERDLA